MKEDAEKRAQSLQHKEEDRSVPETDKQMEEPAVKQATDLREFNSQLRREIAERTRIEQVLRENEERLKAQYKGIPEPTYTWQMQTGDLVLIDYNDAAERLTQGAIQQFMGTKLSEMYRNDPDIITDMTSCYETHHTIQREMPYTLRSTGEEKIFFVSYVYVPPDLVMVHTQDITEQRQINTRLERLNQLNDSLFRPGILGEKLKRITAGIVDIFDADFARIWIAETGDLCKQCVHARVAEDRHLCKNRDQCLHLVASSGRYTHINGEMHQRVPLGCYKIGQIATGKESKFLTNDVTHDPRVHNHAWAEQLGLVSFAGYRLLSEKKTPIGVLALFSKHALSPEENSLLEGLANTVSQVIQSTKAENALRESEKRYKRLVEGSPDILYTFSDTRGSIYCSQRVKDILGYTPEYLRQHPMVWNSSIHPEDQPCVKQAIEGFLKGKSFAIEYRIQNAKGEWRWFYDRSIGRREEKGEILIEGLASDITERKHTEEVLRKAHQGWLDIFEAIGHPTLILDADHTILAANHAVIETTGKSAEQLRELKCYDVFHRPDTEGAPEGCPLHNMLVSGELETVEMEMEALGGTYLVSCTPVLDEVGQLDKIIHIATDITERKHVEEALRLEKEKAQRYFDIAGVMLMVLNVDETVAQINEKGCEILGLPSEHIVGQNWFDTFLPDSYREQLRRGFRDFVSGNVPRQEDMRVSGNENPVVCSDGKERIILWNTAVIFAADGKTIVGVLSSGEDITERQSIERALQESEQKYRHIIESIPVGIHMYQLETDDRLVFIGANPAADSILHVDNTQFLGKTLEEAFPNLQSTEVPHRYRMAASDGIPWHTEHIAYEDEQIVGVFEVHAFQTAPGKMVTAFQDITERKQAELALRKSEEHFRTVVDYSPIAIGISNHTGRIVRVNQKFQDLFGYTLEDIPTVQEWALRAYPDPIYRKEIMTLWEQDVANALQSGWETPTRRYRATCKDGTVRHVEVTTTVIDDRRLVTFHDVTERKKAEEQLQHYADELRGANAELSQYAYVVSHDLKAPLRAIHNYADFLREDLEDSLEDEQRTYLDHLQSAVVEANTLVNDILELSRIGRQEAALEVVNMDTFVDSIIQALDLAEDVDIVRSPDWPVLKTKPVLLRQIFQNLIVNGVKFNTSPRKRIELSWRLLEEGQYEFSVRDNGIGIEPAYQEQIFRVFKRLHTKEEFEGTGVGLAIVKKAVGCLGGTIRIDSIPGKGSTFSVCIPGTIHS